MENMRRVIRETARQVLNRDFELYDLRRFFATWMISKGVPESIVNTLQGRAPPSEYRVLIEHYWSLRHEELRKWYLEHSPCLLCRWVTCLGCRAVALPSHGHSFTPSGLAPL